MRNDLQSETLSAQLTQLNERSRWYATQNWQVPFAFLTLAGGSVAFAFAKDTPPQVKSVVFPSVSVLGALVFWHILGVQKNLKRAVLSLIALEDRMGVAQQGKARYTPCLVHAPMILIVALATLGCIVGSIIGWCRAAAGA